MDWEFGKMVKNRKNSIVNNLYYRCFPFNFESLSTFLLFASIKKQKIVAELDGPKKENTILMDIACADGVHRFEKQLESIRNAIRSMKCKYLTEVFHFYLSHFINTKVFGKIQL